MSALRTVEPSRLDELAASIVEHHLATQQHARLTLEHAIACGEALAEARGLVPEGGWIAWVRENVGIHKGTVDIYIRFATFSDELRAAGVDTVQKARDYVRDHGLYVEYGAERRSEEVVFEIRLLSAEGLSQRKIARQLGIGKSGVGRILRGERYREGPTAPRRPARRRIPITDEMIETVAMWLCERYDAWPVTDAVRNDALELLGAVLEAA